MVTEVESGTPAQQAGIRKGDVIIAADGKKTDSAQALLGSIQKSEPIVVRVERGGREAEFLVTAGKTPIRLPARRSGTRPYRGDRDCHLL